MNITVAEIIGCHGIKGNVKVKSLSDNIHRFDKGRKLFLDDKELTIEESFSHKNNLIIKFKEFNNINEVNKFIGHELTIDEKDLGKLEDNEYYLFDLIGLDVYENGQKKGRIKDIITGVYPNDVYLIETDKTEVMIPALNATIKKVDLENKKIEVRDFDQYE